MAYNYFPRGYFPASYFPSGYWGEETASTTLHGVKRRRRGRVRKRWDLLTNKTLEQARLDRIADELTREEIHAEISLLQRSIAELKNRKQVYDEIDRLKTQQEFYNRRSFILQNLLELQAEIANEEDEIQALMLLL